VPDDEMVVAIAAAIALSRGEMKPTPSDREFAQNFLAAYRAMVAIGAPTYRLALPMKARPSKLGATEDLRRDEIIYLPVPDKREWPSSNAEGSMSRKNEL
jgi:hypothetical protein